MKNKSREILQRALTNISQSEVDDAVQENISFRSETGLKNKIIRESSGHCCAWCDALAGVYDADDAPEDIYRRHDNCTCTVYFKSEKGYENAHSKKIVNKDLGKRIEERLISYESNDKIRVNKLLKYPTSGDSIGISLENKSPEQIEFEVAFKEQLKSKNNSNILTEVLNTNHKIFAKYTPKQMKQFLEDIGWNVKPLSDGNFKGITFEDGGGFKINFGGDGEFQWHPESRSHHHGEYWKVSNGRYGKLRYDKNGDPTD